MRQFFTRRNPRKKDAWKAILSRLVNKMSGKLFFEKKSFKVELNTQRADLVQNTFRDKEENRCCTKPPFADHTSIDFLDSIEKNWEIWLSNYVTLTHLLKKIFNVLVKCPVIAM